MTSEAWVAIGTWVLAIATPAITLLVSSWARADVSKQTAVTERMARAHIDMLREDLRAQLLLHYETRWDSADMITRRKRLANYLLPSVNTSVPYPYDEITDVVPNFFETIGLLCEREQLDRKMVDEIFGYYARRYGQMLGPFFVKDREQHADQGLWSGFERLIETLRAIEKQDQRGLPHTFSGDELKQFFQEEMLL